MDPWTLYWQANRLHSCLAAEADHAEAVDDFWVRFGRLLPEDAQLIDLATGNGAVPLALRRAGLGLPITAVDRAAIDPLQFLDAADSLAGVDFLGGIDLGVPLDLGRRFDAATSQFGLEYLPAESRAPALAGVLRPGARFQLLLHHADSAVVTPRRRDLEELHRLLAPTGPVAAAAAFSEDRLQAGDLEAAGRRHLAQPEPRTRRLSGQVLAGLDRILTLAERGDPGARSGAAELHQRVRAEATRLEQLLEAALTEAAFAALKKALTDAGLVVTVAAPFEAVGDGTPTLIGWQLAGSA